MKRAVLPRLLQPTDELLPQTGEARVDAEVMCGWIQCGWMCGWIQCGWIQCGLGAVAGMGSGVL